MVSCATYSDTVECALGLSNDFNIKLIILFVGLFYALVGLYFSKYVKKEENYINFWLFYSLRVFPTIYISFFLLLLFTLRHSVSLDIFLTILVGGYFVILALFIGMSIYYGGSTIFKIFGFDDWNEFQESRRYSKGMRGRDKR